MKAIILAGGKGTRLLPLTDSIPKPMVMIAGKPLLQYQIDLLKDNGFTEITLIVNYLGEKIKDYFQDGTKFGVKIDYVFETEPLGTAGTIGKMAKKLHEEFLVLYGDLLLNIDLKSLVKFHKKHKGLGTLVVHPNNHPEDSDLLEVGENGIISSIYSKPHSDDLIYHNLVNAAIYIFNPTISKFIPKEISSD
ncbi:MAG: D,D-heptose 1,7-bisphosphate phosphatase, partial [bacterium]|nr:D,D-heptose 1,7-bisphosphate phosphatase [bacterium]